MSASKPERRAPAASLALEDKSKFSDYLCGSFDFDSVAKTAGKKAPQAEPSVNLETKRVQRFFESRMVRPEIAVITMANPINLKFPNLSARTQKEAW